ncbi:MAG: hypothetical protein KAT62_00815 [Desulfuromonadales bacterium]|nr:hypothetical protein [Desulfuromonadales bacterium]
MTLEAAIASGPMNNGDNLTINGGAVVTCTQTPSVLIGSLTINDGDLFIDGLNISSGNIINFIGEYNTSVVVNGRGIFKITGDWFSLGTTDGTDNQSIDLSSYYGSSFVDVINGLWIETGRRIYYDTEVGDAPEIYDWVEKSSDKTLRGMILENNTTNKYLVVKLLTGVLADDDDICVVKLVDDKGPDMQVSWTAKVNHASGDIKEAGIYHPFGNAVTNRTAYLTEFGTGFGGLCFAHVGGTSSLTLGGVTGGFKPPSGCDIKVPNVNIGTSDITNYVAGDIYTGVITAAEGVRWNLSGTSGSLDFSVCNLGSSYFSALSLYSVFMEYVAYNIAMGSGKLPIKPLFDTCICANDPYGRNSGSLSTTAFSDLVSGGEARDCLNLFVEQNAGGFRADTSVDILFDRCICILGGLVKSSIEHFELYVVKGALIRNCVLVSHMNAAAVGWPQRLDSDGSSDIVVENMYVGYTNDGTQSLYTSTGIRDFHLKESSNVMIKGFREVLGSSSLIALVGIYDSNNIKVRAFGMIDEKITRSDINCSKLVEFSGLCSDIDIARVWFDGGLVEEFIGTLVTARNTIISNCSSDYAGMVEVLSGDSILFRGIHACSGYPGGTNGVDLTLAGAFGYQVHDGFNSDTTGWVACLMIPNGVIANKSTVIAGNPKFFKDCDLDMVSGDIIEFEQSYYMLGHTGFTGQFTAVIGSASYGADEWPNIDIYFQYDLNDGNGWNGSWLDVRTAANLTGISVDPADGVKLKFRLEATGTQVDMSGLVLATTTTIAAQKANFYPIDQVECDVNMTNIVVGSQYRIQKTSDGSELASGVAGTTTATETLALPSGTQIDVIVRKGSSGTKYLPFETSGVTNETEITVYIAQVEDSIA